MLNTNLKRAVRRKAYKAMQLAAKRTRTAESKPHSTQRAIFVRG